MTNLIVMLLLAAAQGGPGPGPGLGERIDLRDRLQGPTPVTDKFLLPPKIPDCRTKEDAEQALADKRAGEREKCDPERFLRVHRS